MKKLFYLSALGLMLLAASCDKGVLPGPKKRDTLISVILRNCDTAKLINYVLSNSTGIAGYEIVFSGSQNYSSFFPVNGTTTIAIKPGIYSISVIYRVPGHSTEHSFQLNNASPVRGYEAYYNKIELSTCNGPQSFSITP
jgi:hypothetical protein